MGTYHWLASGNGADPAPTTSKDVVLLTGVAENWTFIRAFVTFELESRVVATDFTPLPYWAPSVAAVYWRGELGATTPNNLADSGGDYSHYQGFTWSQNPTDALGGAVNLLYSAPKTFAKLVVNGRRRLLKYSDPTNLLYLSVGHTFEGPPPDGISLRPFTMAWSSRCLFFEP